MSSTGDPLRAFLWGKRRSIRHPRALAVEVQGAQDALAALSLDVSATGLLLRFPLAQFGPEAAEGLDPFLLCETHFRGVLGARFQRHRLKVHLELVRLDYRPDETDHLFVGFRFARPLAEKQLRRLGLDPARCGPEAHGLPSELAHLRAADDPVICRIYARDEGERPTFEGLFLGRGDGTLCVRLHGADLADVGARLREGPVRVEVLDGDRPDWDTQARLQAIGLLDEPPGALEGGLVEAGDAAASRLGAPRSTRSRTSRPA